MAERTIEIPVEELTEEAFRPFGTLIDAQPSEPEFVAPHLRGWQLGFETDAPVQLLMIRYLHGPFEFHTLERHFHVTQGFVPLQGQSSIMVVAPPSATDEPSDLPAPDSVRAFLMDGSIGVMLHRATWHALGRFPVKPPHADFAFITDKATQEDVEAANAGAVAQRTQFLDTAKELGVRYLITGVG